MNRRDFLRALMSAPLASSVFLYGSPFATRMRSAHAASGKTLVAIFKRGGCDGLNTVVPYGDADYYNLRPTIGISQPGPGADTAIDLDGFFGLHPSLTPLYEIYQNNHLALMPTVHYVDASRSHFTGQALIESGDTQSQLADGWLNRHLSSFPQSGAIRAASFGQLVHALRGDAPVSTINGLGEFGLPGSDSGNFLADITEIYEQQIPPSDANRALVHDHGRIMIENIALLNSIDPDNYTPANGAVYPNTGYGTHLRQIAQLIKEGVGLEIATVNIGGWDTHSNQGGPQGRQSSRFAEYSAGVAAFYKDMQGSPHFDNVLLLTMTEFGRTGRENASGGTDHGNAATWIAAGGPVEGGIYGDWPGLRVDQLYRERYLAHTIEYLDVFYEVIDRHLGNGVGAAQVFPGHNYQPVGFLSA